MLAVLAEVADALELDLDELRDDWFIETCDDWAVPYIGALVGAAPMHDAGGLVHLRAWVADAIALRRRKGTLAAIEAAARAVTAYPTVAVETRRLLGWHQHLAHQRATRSAFAAISGETLEPAGGTGRSSTTSAAPSTSRRGWSTSARSTPGSGTGFPAPTATGTTTCRR